MNNQHKPGVVAFDNARLFRALAEELRLPLLQIARRSELAQAENDTAQLKTIETTADAALQLIDSYIFSTQILLGQQTLELEPVSLKGTLYDTAQYLSELAQLYDQKLAIKVSGRCGLVMAHPQGLQAALTSLAYAFISAQNSTEKSGRIVLTAHKTKFGVTTGVISTQKTMTQRTLNNARQLLGQARQPFAASSHASSAGIYVADSLFTAMSSELKVARQHGTSGLLATLLPSYQLALF